MSLCALAVDIHSPHNDTPKNGLTLLVENLNVFTADGKLYPKEAASYTLDAQGARSIPLVCPDSAGSVVEYQITLPDTTKQTIQIVGGTTSASLAALWNAALIPPGAAAALESRVAALESQTGGGGESGNYITWS